MKVPHGTRRPEYVRNPDHSRDPPSDREMRRTRACAWRVSHLKGARGKPGSKIWRKARRGRL